MPQLWLGAHLFTVPCASPQEEKPTGALRAGSRAWCDGGECSAASTSFQLRVGLHQRLALSCFVSCTQQGPP